MSVVNKDFSLKLQISLFFFYTFRTQTLPHKIKSQNFFFHLFCLQIILLFAVFFSSVIPKPFLIIELYAGAVSKDVVFRRLKIMLSLTLLSGQAGSFRDISVSEVFAFIPVQ